MKARSKAAKRAWKRAARGRPRNEDVSREPNGRASRAKEPADTVAITARMKHMGLTAAQARDQKAETFIGYLSLLGPRDGISADQYKGAEAFLQLRASYLRAIKAPNALADNGIPGGAGDEISEAYEEWAMNTKERYADCRRAIQEAQNTHRGANLWAALDLCVIQDQPMYHMIGDLRIVCNALHRHLCA